MTTVTRDEVWALFREVARRFEETDRQFMETKRMFQDTDRKFQDTDRKFQDTDQQFQEIKLLFKETQREIKAVSESVGRLSNRLGEFVEEAVRPSAVRLFKERGIEVHEVHQNVVAKRHGEGLEIDLLVVNEQYAIAIECKSNLGNEHIKDHINRLEKIKRLIPTYSSKQILGAVAGMVIPENVARYAMSQGLYVIGQNGDHLELRNDEQFIAKVW